MKMPLLNGVYDLTTNTLEPHRQENHFLYQVPVKYDPNATCPRIDTFLEQVFGEERKKLGYEIAGDMLCANAEPQPNKWQRAFMLLGAGANAKSTYLNLVTKLLGEDNVSNQTLQMLIENRFAVAALDHKLANIAADIGDRSVYNAAQFKALTGGDKIKKIGSQPIPEFGPTPLVMLAVAFTLALAILERERRNAKRWQ